MIRLVALVLLSATAATATPRADVSAGTSLTYGYSHVSSPYSAELEDLLHTPVDNFGVGGDRLATIISRWQTYAKPYPYRRCIFEGGTNDLFFDSANGTTLWGTFKDWIEEAQTPTATRPGCQVAIILVPPRWGSAGWTSDMETQRLAFNSAARTYVIAHPSVLMFDSDVELGTGSPVALDNDCDHGDDLHWSQSCHERVAAGLRNLFRTGAP
jgi:hypothetical protein